MQKKLIYTNIFNKLTRHMFYVLIHLSFFIAILNYLWFPFPFQQIRFSTALQRTRFAGSEDRMMSITCIITCTSGIRGIHIKSDINRTAEVDTQYLVLITCLVFWLDETTVKYQLCNLLLKKRLWSVLFFNFNCKVHKCVLRGLFTESMMFCDL